MAIILDMELPLGCVVCPLVEWDDDGPCWRCVLTDKQADKMNRPKWCPIIGEAPKPKEEA